MTSKAFIILIRKALIGTWQSLVRYQAAFIWAEIKKGLCFSENLLAFTFSFWKRTQGADSILKISSLVLYRVGMGRSESSGSFFGMPKILLVFWLPYLLELGPHQISQFTDNKLRYWPWRRPPGTNIAIYRFTLKKSQLSLSQISRFMLSPIDVIVLILQKDLNMYVQWI